MIQNYEEKIKELISNKSGIDIEDIHNGDYFDDDLNLAELEVIEIIEEVEELFEIEGLIEKKEDIETVGDLIDFASDKIE